MIMYARLGSHNNKRHSNSHTNLRLKRLILVLEEMKICYAWAVEMCTDIDKQQQNQTKRSINNSAYTSETSKTFSLFLWCVFASFFLFSSLKLSIMIYARPFESRLAQKSLPIVIVIDK